MGHHPQWRTPYLAHPLVRAAPHVRRREAQEGASVVDVEFRGLIRRLESAPPRELAARIEEAAHTLWTWSLRYPGPDAEAWYAEKVGALMRLAWRRLGTLGLEVEIVVAKQRSAVDGYDEDDAGEHPHRERT